MTKSIISEGGNAAVILIDKKLSKYPENKNLAYSKITDSDLDKIFPQQYGKFPSNGDNSVVGKILLVLSQKGLIDNSYSPQYLLGSSRLAAYKHYGAGSVPLDKYEDNPELLKKVSAQKTSYGDLDIDIKFIGSGKDILNALESFAPKSIAGKGSNQEINLVVKVANDRAIQIDLINFANEEKEKEFAFSQASSFLDLSQNVKGLFQNALLRIVLHELHPFGDKEDLKSVLSLVKEEPNSDFALKVRNKIEKLGYTPVATNFTLGSNGVVLVLRLEKENKGKFSKTNVHLETSKKADFNDLDKLAQVILQDDSATKSDISHSVKVAEFVANHHNEKTITNIWNALEKSMKPFEDRIGQEAHSNGMNQMKDILFGGNLKEEFEIKEAKRTKKIAVFAGSFKPPHVGHYNSADKLLNSTNSDKIFVFISKKERAGHSADKKIIIDSLQSEELWNLYTKNDQRYDIRISNNPSPIVDVYQLMEAMSHGDILYVGMGEDEDQRRFSKAQAWSDKNNLGIEVKIIILPRTFSGTKMRELVASEDKENFQKYLPEHLSSREKEEAWSIISKGTTAEQVGNLVERILFEEDYQSRIKKNHKSMKSRIISTGANKKSEPPFTEDPEKERSKSAPAGFGALEEDFNIENEDDTMEDFYDLGFHANFKKDFIKKYPLTWQTILKYGRNHVALYFKALHDWYGQPNPSSVKIFLTPGFRKFYSFINPLPSDLPKWLFRGLSNLSKFPEPGQPIVYTSKKNKISSWSETLKRAKGFCDSINEDNNIYVDVVLAVDFNHLSLEQIVLHPLPKGHEWLKTSSDINEFWDEREWVLNTIKPVIVSGVHYCSLKMDDEERRKRIKQRSQELKRKITELSAVGAGAIEGCSSKKPFEIEEDINMDKMKSDREYFYKMMYKFEGLGFVLLSQKQFEKKYPLTWQTILKYGIKKVYLFLQALDGWYEESNSRSMKVFLTPEFKEFYSLINPLSNLPKWLFRGLSDLKKFPEPGQSILYTSKNNKVSSWTEKLDAAKSFCDGLFENKNLNEKYQDNASIVLAVDIGNISPEQIILHPLPNKHELLKVHGTIAEMSREKEWALNTINPIVVSGIHYCNIDLTDQEKERRIHQRSQELKRKITELSAVGTGAMEGSSTKKPFELEEEISDKLPGGLADETSYNDYDQEQLIMGIDVELEHTDDVEIAAEIAKDHLSEKSDYYDELKKMEDGEFN